MEETKTPAGTGASIDVDDSQLYEYSTSESSGESNEGEQRSLTSWDQSQVIEPTLPSLDPEDLIERELFDLVMSKAPELRKERSLSDLSKRFEIPRLILRKELRKIEKQYVESETKESPLSEKELEAKAQTEAEAEAKSQYDLEWQKLVQERSREIANLPNILAEFQKAMRSRFGYIASEPLAFTVCLSHAFRLLPKSAGFVFHGMSGSGKSAALEFGAEFLPPEIVVRYTTASNRALFYAGDLKHKYIVGGELSVLKPGEDDSYQQALRQLISENRITRAVVEKNDEGKFEQVIHVTEGPAVFVMSTTREQQAFHDEFINRLSWVQTSDAPALTEEVLEVQAVQAKTIPDSDIGLERQWEIEAWQCFHREVLSPIHVVIPYADEIKLKSKDVTARRLFPLLLNYVKACALLHQCTRKRVQRDDCEYIEAELFDYEVAYSLLRANGPRTLEAVSKKGREVYCLLQDRFSSMNGAVTQFDRATAQAVLNMPRPTTQRYLFELERAGCLKVDDRHKSFLYELLSAPGPEQDLGLISPEELRCAQSAHPE